MLFQRLNRSDPERVFIVARASEAVAADDAAIWETASASVDGVRVRLPDTGHSGSVVGVFDAAISDAAYGLVQVYGYRTTSRVFQTNTSQDTGVLLAVSLGAASGGTALQSVASSTTSNADVVARYPFFVLAETIASSSASATISAKIFIRML